RSRLPRLLRGPMLTPPVAPTTVEPAPASTVVGLRCRECAAPYPKAALHVCERCFGPLEIAYDYDAVRARLDRQTIARRPAHLWRYRELLPVDGEPSVGLATGMTPLVRAERLAATL